MKNKVAAHINYINMIYSDGLPDSLKKHIIDKLEALFEDPEYVNVITMPQWDITGYQIQLMLDQATNLNYKGGGK